MAVTEPDDFQHAQSRTLDQNYPIDWVPHRQVSGVMYLLPPVVISWRGFGPSQTSLHIGFNCWLRQSDGRIIIATDTSSYLACGRKMLQDEVWYGLMPAYPVGWDLVPAVPDKDRPVCMHCLRWFNQLRYHAGAMGRFLAQPGHVKDRPLQRPSYRGDTRWIGVLELLRKGNPTFDGMDQTVDPKEEAAVESDDDDEPGDDL